MERQFKEMKFSISFIKLVLISLLMGSLTGCSQPENFNQMVLEVTDQTIPFTYVKELQDHEVLMLDARDEAEFEVSHIKGAKRIGYTDFDQSILNGVSKDSEIVVYCSVGYRSEKIAEKIQDLGYTNVRNLFGGIFAWKNAGYEVVNRKGVTEKVHAYNEDWGRWLFEGEKVYEK